VSLLSRDFNVFASTKSNHRIVLEQLKQLALQNNTTGASIYDLGNIIKSESVAELTSVLKKSEEKTLALKQQELQQQQQMQQELLKSQEQQKQMEMQYKAEEAEKDRQNNIIVSQIRSAGYGSMMDINQNQMSDYQDAMKDIQKQDNYREQMNLDREREINKQISQRETNSIKEREIQSRERVADKQLQIARTNKNKYDKSDNKKKKE
jgi:hypothetical protein